MARAKREVRKRTRVCPECQELFAPQGLNGHLRWKHGLEVEAVKAQTEAATVTVADGLAERADVTTELVNQLNGIQTEISKLPPSTGGFWDNPKCDGSVEDCRTALQDRELEIRNEIRKLSGKRPLKRTTKRGWLGRTTDELVEDDGRTTDEPVEDGGSVNGEVPAERKGPLDF